MERVDGHLEKDDKTVVRDVMACFDIHGEGRWDGQLIVPPNSPIEEADYLLVLDDGRKGTIYVNAVSHRHGQPNPDVWFEGKGSLSAEQAAPEPAAPESAPVRPKGGLYGRRKPRS